MGKNDTEHKQKMREYAKKYYHEKVKPFRIRKRKPKVVLPNIVSIRIGCFQVYFN